MRFFKSLILLLLVGTVSYGQLVNNGGTITIESAATLRVEANLSNNSGSTITNNGTIEVQNNLTNAGTITSGSSSKIAFIGSVNSDVTSGGATFRYVEMKKTAQNITLLDEMKISNTLDFVNASNHVKTGNNNLRLLAGASITNAGSNKYVETNGTGLLIKELTANASKTFEVGDATYYSPVSCAVVGTTYANASVGARSYTTGLTAKYSETTDYISREWQITATGITGYENTMTGTYVDTDINGTESLIKGAYYTTDWKFDSSTGNAGVNQIGAKTTNNSVKLSGMNFFGKASLKAFLAGALSGSNMTKTLNSGGLIPLATPYTVAPFNAPTMTAPSIPAEATDWILVEVRDASNPSTIIAQTSAFILKDGNIVNFDGASLRLKNAVANGIIALRHRNHLSIRTSSGMDLVNPTLKNFSLGIAEAYTNPSITTNDNMINKGGIYAMWPGDVNQDGKVRYLPQAVPPIPADANLILTGALGGVPTTVLNNVYSIYDVDLNKIVRYLPQAVPPVPADINIILTESLNGVPNAMVQRHF